MAIYQVYMCLSVVLLTWCWTRGENCHVNPECNCSRYNGSSVYCNPTCGPNIPKFSPSSVQFEGVDITGKRDFKRIPDDSFQGMVTNSLSIHNTGISDIPCTAWSGLEDTLTSLYLGNNYLTSVPSCSLLRLSKLQYLRLQNNNITVISSEAFRGVSSLRSLKIERNKVEDIEVNAFNGLTQLKYLYLNRNQIAHLEGSHFRGLESLTDLRLSWNRLSVLHPRVFTELQQLRYLYLDDNNITSLDSTVFQDLINLRYLYIRNNRICALPQSVFMYNIEMNQLYLEGNCLSSLHENLFRWNSKISYLNLDGNYLTNLSSRVFRNLSRLSTIDIQNNKLTQIDENIFRGSPNIKYIYLKNNNIHTLHNSTLVNLRNLYRLDLRQNDLQRIDSDICVNCSRLYDLSFSQNRICFMHKLSLSSLSQLGQLNLDQNSLSSSSWTSLLTVISKVPTLRWLDLSHNPIQTVPSTLFNSTKPVTVILRNCSLDSLPYGLTNTSVAGNGLDISSNNLKSFGTVDSPQSVSFQSLNLSNNYLQTFNILPSKSYLGYIFLEKNSVQLPIFIRGLLPYISINWLVLSYNHIQNVTQFPITVFTSTNTQPENPCDDSRHFNVNTLNLSRNAISFISPEACLGIVTTLDLSYNQLSVFGKLMPSRNSSRTRLRYLYMSGNNIHQVSSDPLVGFEVLYYLDFRFNNIQSLQFTEKYLKETTVRNAKFSGNPINCDCSSVWLRNNSIPNKVDSARCQSPASARGYLVYCYPITDCPDQIEVTDDTREICGKDSALELYDLTFTSHESVADVFWTKTGPGMLSGYRLELRELNGGRVAKTLLIHPEMSNTTVSNLRFQQSYNVCLSAQLHGKRVSNEICNQVTIGGGDTLCAGLDVVIGLSVTLGLCLITAVSLVICALSTGKVCHHTENIPESGRPQVKHTETTGENTNMYLHKMKATGNQPNNEELYETLHNGQYENTALEM